jgi:hypothetical protein
VEEERIENLMDDMMEEWKSSENLADETMEEWKRSG